MKKLLRLLSVLVSVGFLSPFISTPTALITTCNNNNNENIITVELNLTNEQWTEFTNATKSKWESAQKKIEAMILNYTAFKNEVAPKDFPCPSE